MIVPDGLNISHVIASEHWAIIYNMYGLDPTSDMMAHMYLNVLTVWSFWPLELIFV